MIKELAEFGKRIRTGHDALKDEPISVDLIINDDGSFVSFSVIEKISRPAEAITAKKGKARLLLDKAEEVLCYGGEKSNKKHQLFIDKLNLYEDLKILVPVFAFYLSNKENGVNKALHEFENQVEEKDRGGNIAFRIHEMRIHEQKEAYEAIIEHFERNQIEQLKGEKKECSICGKTDFPVLDQPHGLIKRVPDGQSAGCALISYNENAFESYNLKGNINSSICTNCAKNYVEGLNYLLTYGYIKGICNYSNRRNFGSDTAMVFWTSEPEALDEMDWFDKPDAGRVANLIESVAKAKNKVATNLKTNHFYSITLSGAAARIAIRDWIEISLDEYKQNISKWFEDVQIAYYDFNIKELKSFYPSLNQLAWNCGSLVQSKRDTADEQIYSRVAKHLWRCALKNQSPPLWILTVLLKRIGHDETNSEGESINTFTTSRASLIRFILNRNNNGGIEMKEGLDFENNTSAYLCGRLFALIEGIQRVALGKNINAGVRERFFSAASASPSPAFGRLLRLMQNHLTKIRQEKPGLAVILDTEVTDLCSKINQFPVTLTLEQQGQFALGYYHQKNHTLSRAKQNNEFESLTDNNMEEQ